MAVWRIQPAAQSEPDGFKVAILSARISAAELRRKIGEPFADEEA